MAIFAKAVSIEGAGLGNFDGLERGPYSEGFTGDLEGIKCGKEQVARNNSAVCIVSVIRKRLFAERVEMASRAARKPTDNLDEKKVLSSDCIIFLLGSNAISTPTPRG